MSLNMVTVGCIGYLVLLMAKPSSGQQAVFVTKYGAVADGKTDNSKAFTDAWNAACQYEGNASLVIPQGTFLVGPVIFKGPCYNNTSPSILIQGTVKAPASLAGVPTIGWLEFRELEGLAVAGGGTVDGQGAELSINKKGDNNLPISMRFINVSNATIGNLTLVDSKGFHVAVQRSSNVKVQYLNISAPAESHNTDGVHVSGSDHVDIADLTVSTGDDCVSIGPGSVNVSISGVVCGPGHGISVGSLGKYQNEKDVVGVKVTNCTVSGTSNGIRIKTWPGSPPSQASDLTFENIVMDNVSNPILIDQVYCPGQSCGAYKASMVKVSDVTFKDIRGTSRTPVAVKLMCSQSVPCENVQLQDINLQGVESDNSNITSFCFHVMGKALGTSIPSLCI